MRKYFLTVLVSGMLMLGGTLALAKEARSGAQKFANTEIQGQQGSPILSFEHRLKLKPLSDEELEQITAAGFGPVMPFPFQPSLFLPFAFPSHDFLTFGLPGSSQVQRTIQIQGSNVR